MNMEEQLRSVVDKATADGDLWHTIIHGTVTTEVPTENGKVPTVAKHLKDVRDAIVGGVIDVVSRAETARDIALEAQNITETLKSDTQSICDETLSLRNEAEGFKNQSQSTFNNIVPATNAAILSVETAGDGQVARVQATGTEQVAEVVEAGIEQTNNAKDEADRALYYAQSASPTPLGSKLTVPACAKVPDGYEPTWYKNTITRARYPDFFEKLVDTDDLFCLNEATYDAQMAEFGMCNGYVKVDDDTLILPLLLNYGRGGTLGQVGQVQKDQFQGHWHEFYAPDSPSSAGYSGEQANSLGNLVPSCRNPITDWVNGTPRVGDETRPKSYFELTYIKCADVVRPLAVEETSEIRNLLFNKVDLDLGNLLADVLNDKLFETIVDGKNWYVRNKVTGWTEQGGLTPAVQAGTIVFIKPFINPALNVQLTQHYNAASRADKYTPQVVGVPSNAAFNYGWGSGYVGGSYLHWRACGY